MKGGGYMKSVINKYKNNVSKIINKIKNFFQRYKYISGITVIELVLILVIIIALLLIFKTQLIDLINTIFDKITAESSSI